MILNGSLNLADVTLLLKETLEQLPFRTSYSRAGCHGQQNDKIATVGFNKKYV